MRVLLVDFNPFAPSVTPISLGSLGAVLRAAGHDVRLLSLGAESRFSVATLRESLTDFGPRLVGFGTYQRNLLPVRALARLVHAVLPDALVALGGPHASFLPLAALPALTEVDFVSRGEGELTIRGIVEAIEAGGEATPIAGVARRTTTEGWVEGPPLVPPAHLDDYPSPWLTGVLDPAAREESVLLTSRGCPSDCAFCLTPASGRRVRAHSVERVLADIEFVVRRGSGRLWFADPNFSFNRQRVTALLEGILQRDLTVSMWVETRADMLSRSLAALMKRAGVHTLAMGLESAADAVHPTLDKGVRPARVAEAVRVAFEAGLDVELFCQYALPHETLADALGTLRFVKNAGVAVRGNSNAQQMQLYFGSRIAQDPHRYGVRPLHDERPPYLAVGTAFETDWMSSRQIRQVREAWRAASLDGGKRVVS